MIIQTVVLIIIFSFILIKSADIVVIAIRRLGKKDQAKAFTLSALVLAISTSLPELSVGVAAALEGNPNISLGDIVGSNIANISLVAGLASVIVGKVNVRGGFLRRDVFIALIAGILPALLLFDKSLSRLDGLILLFVYGAYASSFFKIRFGQIAEEQEQEDYVYRFLRTFNHVAARRSKELGRLFIGVALLLFSAGAIVKVATSLAESVGIPSFLVGLAVVAIGTSLPEFAFSIRSLGKHSPSMFFGNLLGSTIANSTLVMGIVALIRPIAVVAPKSYFSAVIFFVVIFSAFWFFIRTKHRLDRWEGVMLIMLYIIFIAIEFV